MTRCGCYSPFLSFVHFWTPIKHDVANIISLLSCSDRFPCFHPHKSTCTEAVQRCTDSVAHTTDLPNSRLYLNHHEPPAYGLQDLTSKPIFPLSFLPLKCLFSSQTAHAFFSLSQWTFLLLTPHLMKVCLHSELPATYGSGSCKLLSTHRCFQDFSHSLSWLPVLQIQTSYRVFHDRDNLLLPSSSRPVPHGKGRKDGGGQELEAGLWTQFFSVAFPDTQSCLYSASFWLPSFFLAGTVGGWPLPAGHVLGPPVPPEPPQQRQLCSGSSTAPKESSAPNSPTTAGSSPPSNSAYRRRILEAGNL